MKTKQKKEILTAISKNLAAFSPKFIGKFVCPICLDIIDLNEIDRISEAHIIPKVAATGKKHTTWLCTHCNNTFGSSFDKWFGEYINYQQKNFLLNEKITKGQLTLNSIEFNGTVRTRNGFIDFIISNFNSPKKLKELEEETKVVGQKKLSINIPLLSKREEINIGLLTAAYLYGFTLFGYSWIFQKRFQIIRDLILRKKSIKDDTNSMHISKVTSSADSDSHWFGIVAINSEFIPCIRIYGNMVFFTPFYNQNVLQLINKEGVSTQNIRILKNISHQQYHKPLIYTIDNKVIVFPDETIFGDITPDFVVVTTSENWETKVLTQEIDYSNPPKIGKNDSIIRVHIND